MNSNVFYFLLVALGFSNVLYFLLVALGFIATVFLEETIFGFTDDVNDEILNETDEDLKDGD